MQYDEIMERLETLCWNMEADHPDGTAELYIAGSAALILHKTLSRGTTDVDTFTKANIPIESFLNAYNINSNITAYEDCFALGYEGRASLLMEGKNLKIYLLSLEDVVVSKLATDRDSYDENDIFTADTYQIVDIEKVKKLSHNVIDNVLSSKTRAILAYNIKKYEERYNEYAKEHSISLPRKTGQEWGD